MPAVHTEPPADGAYKHVLVRFDYGWDFPVASPYYDEHAESRGIVHRGQRLCTLFVSSEHHFDFLLKTGWLDRSDQWFQDHPSAFAALQKPEETAAPVEPKPKEITAPQTPAAASVDAAEGDESKDTGDTGEGGDGEQKVSPSSLLTVLEAETIPKLKDRLIQLGKDPGWFKGKLKPDLIKELLDQLK